MQPNWLSQLDDDMITVRNMPYSCPRSAGAAFHTLRKGIYEHIPQQARRLAVCLPRDNVTAVILHMTLRRQHNDAMPPTMPLGSADNALCGSGGDCRADRLVNRTLLIQHAGARPSTGAGKPHLAQVTELSLCPPDIVPNAGSCKRERRQSDCALELFSAKHDERRVLIQALARKPSASAIW